MCSALLISAEISDSTEQVPRKLTTVAEGFERLPEPRHRPSPHVEKVLLYQKTHFDVGFTDFANAVLTKYLENHLPRALELSESFKGKNGEPRFAWTTGSFLPWFALNKWRGSQRRKLERALLDGRMTWHALPFTFQSESMQPHLYEASLFYTDWLADRFSITAQVAIQTDVPGHTAGIVPILVGAGVSFFHLGINPASALPRLPRFFLWKVGKEVLPVMLEHDYGGVQILPGSSCAIAFSFTSDNSGPPSAEDFQALWERLQRRFPNAQIKSVGLNELVPEVASSSKSWPIYDGEIGDSWIRGYASDPWKMARFRALQRLRGEWKQRGQFKGSWVRSFDESLLLTAEHTWGLDEKSHLTDGRLYHKERTYDKKSFHKKLATPAFRNLAASWNEQREYVESAVRCLSKAPIAMRQQVADALEELTPRGQKVPSKAKYCRTLPDGVIPFEIVYEAFGSEDYEKFKDVYVTPAYLKSFWAVPDFTKPGLEAVNRKRRTFVARLLKAYQVSQNGHWLFEMSFPGVACEKFGAPRHLQFKAFVEKQGNSTHQNLRLDWFDKDPYRGAEALWIRFLPEAPGNASWSVHKMGRWIALRDVCRRAGRPLHGIDIGARLQSLGRVLTIKSLDAALGGPGLPDLLSLNDSIPSPKLGFAFCLYNNTWTTNFPMWNGEDAAFRFLVDDVCDEGGTSTEIFGTTNGRVRAKASRSV